jgi:murein DD-endopeptidase MepM/ murein hydrolase activator NlpD
LIQPARVPSIFPTLAAARWAEVDLDGLSRTARPPGTPNSLLDAGACGRFVDGVAESLGADHTHGGYGEDRGHLWEGHYLPAGKAVHLGIDLNVPAGTPVTTPAACRVVRSRADPDQDGGWGGFVVLALDEPLGAATHVAYGHLAHAGLPPEGTRFRKGDVVGTVGGPAENGGWFPHLHVQCLDAGTAAEHGPGFEAMDGYGAPADLAGHPDPGPLVMAG